MTGISHSAHTQDAYTRIHRVGTLSGSRYVLVWARGTVRYGGSVDRVARYTHKVEPETIVPVRGPPGPRYYE